MRLSIDHRTVYRFSEAQSRLVQMLRMTPENSHDQTVARWRIDVDCDATMRRGRDGFGNAVTMLYAEGPIHDIEIAVRGEVLTSHSDGVVRGVNEVLPPAVFLRASARRERGMTLFAAAWGAMVKHHEHGRDVWQPCDVPASDWVDHHCPAGHDTRFDDFPASLRAFLQRSGYISS